MVGDYLFKRRVHMTDTFLKLGKDIIDTRNLDIIRENANVNGESFSGKMGKMGSEACKEYAKRYVIPEEIMKYMDEGYMHIHDLDFYALGTHNCLFIPFGKILASGFYVGDKGSVRTPNSISTAMAQVAIIFQAQQNSQYGGCGASKIDWDLAPYVKKSYNKHYKKGLEYFLGTHASAKLFAERETKAETLQAAESMIHNLNTMASRAGGQVPFSSICFGLDTSWEGRLVSECILQASINGLGHGETAIFPQLIFQCKQGINQNEGEANYDLFLKAIECSSKRLFPNFVNVDATYNLQYYKENDPDTIIGTMGCRTRIISNRHGDNHQSGRGNLSFNSINLPKIGIESKGDIKAFYDRLEEVMTICLEGLIHRYKIQYNQPAKASDFMMANGTWMDGEKLDPEEKVGEILKHGSISIGFVGLAECLKALVGKHHGESKEAWDLGYNIISFMREFCDRWSDDLDMNLTLFATPAESLAGKFAKINQKQFGVIEGVTDREYITNSNHIPVYYDIPAHEKIAREAPFHELTNAGHICYVEVDGNMKNNPEAFKKIVQYALSQNVGYFSINHPIDKCNSCGYDGTIGASCPQCGELEESGRIVKIRRITGYLVGNLMTRFNSGKRAEERDRVKHTK
jgi:ribonucleoside-triphosphate reductase